MKINSKVTHIQFHLCKYEGESNETLKYLRYVFPSLMQWYEGSNETHKLFKVFS